MYKIKVLTARKTKEKWLQEGIDSYEERLQTHLLIEWVIAKDSLKLAELTKKEESFFALDPAGKALSSEGFAKVLLNGLKEGGARLTLVIGDAEGLDPATIKKAKGLLSLSPLTFTHQMTRLILVEQIYRAFEIEKGSGYHK